MLSFQRIPRLIAAGLLGGVVTLLGSLPAHAGDYALSCTPTYHVEVVTVFVPKTVAYRTCVTLYDECGRPYQATQTCHRTIRVPVQKCVVVYDR